MDSDKRGSHFLRPLYPAPDPVFKYTQKGLLFVRCVSYTEWSCYHKFPLYNYLFHLFLLDILYTGTPNTLLLFFFFLFFLFLALFVIERIPFWLRWTHLWPLNEFLDPTYMFIPSCERPKRRNFQHIALFFCSPGQVHTHTHTTKIEMRVPFPRFSRLDNERDVVISGTERCIRRS